MQYLQPQVLFILTWPQESTLLRLPCCLHAIFKNYWKVLNSYTAGYAVSNHILLTILCYHRNCVQMVQVLPFRIIIQVVMDSQGVQLTPYDDWYMSNNCVQFTPFHTLSSYITAMLMLYGPKCPLFESTGSQPWSWSSPSPTHFSVFLAANTPDYWSSQLTALPVLNWVC